MSNGIVLETYEENQPTDVELEDIGESLTTSRPYDASKIRVDPKMFSLREVLELIDEEDLDLAPDFQRRNVWKPLQKCRLIESIFLRIPLPAFYFSSADDGKMQVVDGVQRLSTIRDFAKPGGFVLETNLLEYLSDEVGGKRFTDLNGSIWLRRFNRTQLMANVIDAQTPDPVKFDIFKRINTGGSPLNAQEIRHCMSGPQSRSFLKKCTELPSFRAATGERFKNDVRMVDREIVLRFCAFEILGVQGYSKEGSMDSFLTEATRYIDKNLNDEQRESLGDLFDLAMQNAYKLFDSHSFRKWPLDSDTRNPLNRALFETWSTSLSKYEWSQLQSHQDEIVSKARHMMTRDVGFIDAITTSTGDPARVGIRFKKVNELLGTVLR